MIRGRGHRAYKPPQTLTGYIDDFPLVPETPVDIVPLPSRSDHDRDPERIRSAGVVEGRPILPPPPSRSDEGLPVSTQDRAPEATVSGAREIKRAWEISRDPERTSGVEGRLPRVSRLPRRACRTNSRPPNNETAIESLEAAKELAVTAPSIANEMLPHPRK